ncbi:MAG: MFS transporter [Candidatus Theseobacter exili]|nr:MFS transporter [Candidatus Theseobacter exili]
MQEDNKKNVKTHSRFNFLMGLLHGIFYNGGIAFGSATTVLPAFLTNFTASKVLIGLSSSIMGEIGGVGNILPQLFVASRIEHRSHKRPLLRFAITIRALCWGLLALFTYLFAGNNPSIALWGLFLLLSIFTFMGGVAVVPFMDIWGKTISPDLRGRFFGYRQLLGGFLAIFSGLIVKSILNNSNVAFPDNYALLFLFAFILITISYVALGSVKEPFAEVHKEQLPFYDFLRKTTGILKKDTNFRKFLFIQILSGTIALSLPFFVLYAKDVLKIRIGMIGIFLSAQMLGMVLSTIIWGYLSDHLGSKKVLQLSILFGLLAPLFALLLPRHCSNLFVLLFVFLSFFISGRVISKNSFLLDTAPAKDRPRYVSLEGTFRLPVVFFPLIGGVLVQYSSYTMLFAITGFFLLGAFILSFCLKEPRKLALSHNSTNA